MKKDMVSLREFSKKEILSILDLAASLKKSRKRPQTQSKPLLKSKNIGMYFEKPSLRTWVTFQVAMNDLGGYAINLPSNSIGLGKRETVRDVALNLERWVDGLVARTFSQKLIDKLAECAKIPIINALSDTYHPCQALAFAQTLLERRALKNIKVVFVGDGNNVCNSIMILCSKLGLNFAVAAPKGYQPKKSLLKECVANCAKSKGSVTVLSNPAEAVKDADVIYTDTWASMGQEEEAGERKRAFSFYQVNAALLRRAPKGCLVSHCLPAHRGEEISSSVLDRSMAYDEAENRLHVQKSILVHLLSGKY